MCEDRTSDFIRFICKSISPTIDRHENRIRELDDFLDIERDARMRLEKENIDLTDRLNVTDSHGCESTMTSNQYNDAIRRRDGDITRLRKELDRMSLQRESSEQELRKKNHATVMELQNEIDSLQKHNFKCEKEKLIMLKEIEESLVQCEFTTKQKITLEAKFENVESLLLRSKSNVDDLERQVKEISSNKALLIEENGTLKDTIKDVSQTNNVLRKSKCNLEVQLDDTRKLMEEEIRQKTLVQSRNVKIHNDNEQIKMQLEDEVENHCRVQQQLSRITGEMNALRSKYESEIMEISMCMDDLRKKSNARINDLTETSSKDRARINSLEKSRQQMTMEAAELNAELGRMEEESAQLQYNMKSLETGSKEMDNQLQDILTETTTLRMTNLKLSSENSRLRVNMEEEQLKNNNLNKHVDTLSDELREVKGRVECVTKELYDVEGVVGRLETERTSLANDLDEKRGTLADTERKYQCCQNDLHLVKNDMEQRLTEKNEELETIKKSSQRTIEDLSARLSEVETKYKVEVSKLKKKYECHNVQMEENLNIAKNENSEMFEEMQKSSAKLKEVEKNLAEERQNLFLVKEKLSSSERRRTQLQGDLADSNRLLEAADKCRRNVEMEIEAISSRSADFIAHINSLSNEKRKLENEIVTLKMDLYDVTSSKMDFEERSSKLANEANVLMDELRQAQEVNRKDETLRKNLALELKETKIRLNKRESSVAEDITKNNHIHQERIKDLERELESERSKNKEFQIQSKKQERVLKELQYEVDDERNVMLELQHLLEGAQVKIGGYKRQVEDLEMMNAESLSRYRRAQKHLDEVDVKVDARRNFKGSGVWSTVD